jgi:hypothetical protein
MLFDQESNCEYDTPLFDFSLSIQSKLGPIFGAELDFNDEFSSEFDLERQGFSLEPEKVESAYEKVENLSQQTEAGSTCGGSEVILRKSCSRSSSFDEEEKPKFLDQANPKSNETTALDKILLKMVDCENLNFILKERIELSSSLKEFLACNLEVISKQSFQTIQNESEFDWVQRANKHLQNASQKRKDQKLRMIFNKIVKMLFNKSSKRTCVRETKSSKMESFLQKYAPNQKTEFEDFIKDCKFPSKKKLRAMFSEYKLFRSDFAEVIEKNIFVNEYLLKRENKAMRLVENFHQAQKKYENDRKSVVACLRDCIKSFPWSKNDLETSCSLLYSTLGDSGYQMSL